MDGWMDKQICICMHNIYMNIRETHSSEWLQSASWHAPPVAASSSGASCTSELVAVMSSAQSSDRSIARLCIDWNFFT